MITYISFTVNAVFTCHMFANERHHWPYVRLNSFL